MSTISAASLRCPVEQSAALGNGNIVTPVPAPGQNSAHARAGCRLVGVVSALFKIAYKNAAVLLTQLAEKISAVFSSIYAGYAGATPPVRQPSGPGGAAPGGARGSESIQGGSPQTNGTTICDLPSLPIEHIFHFLERKDKITLSMASRIFRSHFQQWRQQRCRLLLASDAGKHVFGRFGIACPGGETANIAQMDAMVARIHVIIASMKGAVKIFPKSPAYEHSAEALVWQLPPEKLQEALKTAYQCNLYKLFSEHARVGAATTLSEANVRIRSWLDTDEARQITSISACSVQLTCTPAELASLRQLRKLTLWDNQVVCASPEIWDVSGLRVLYLGGNHLDRLPAGIGQLTSLRELVLDRNRLETLPAELGRLTGLELLDLGGNRFGSLPPELGQLTKLQELALDHNRLETVSAEIGRLAGLRALILDGNQLETLPAELGQLTGLEVLSLGENRLETLPAEFWRLAKLGRLYLAQNRLESLPGAIGQLAKLTYLDLSGNPLKSIPAWVEQLPNLRELRLDPQLPIELAIKKAGAEEDGTALRGRQICAEHPEGKA